MKIGERILLIFMSIVFFFLVACVGACLWSDKVLAYALYFVDISVYVKIAITAALLILLVLSIRSIFVSTGKGKENSALAASTNEGGIYINLDTINNLAEKAVKKIADVRDMKVRTVMTKEGAAIGIKVSLSHECVIPEVSATVQQIVKTDIESLCGIAVKKINIQVDNSLQTQKAK